VPEAARPDKGVQDVAGQAEDAARIPGGPYRTKIVTATSELARNIHMYAAAGDIEIHIASAPRAGMRVSASDRGPGIPDLDGVMGGRARSKRGMGLGLRGVKAMADDFTIDSAPGRGTSVSALFCCPEGAPAAS